MGSRDQTAESFAMAWRTVVQMVGPGETVLSMWINPPTPAKKSGLDVRRWNKSVCLGKRCDSTWPRTVSVLVSSWPFEIPAGWKEIFVIPAWLEGDRCLFNN